MNRRNVIVTSAAVALLVSVATSAGAQTKQERHDELVSIGQEIEAVKGNPAARTRVDQLRARYSALSDSLGGDDPAAVSESASGATSRSAAANAQGAPGVNGGGAPPDCLSSVDTVTSTDTPIAIPDGPGGMASSTITVSGLDSYIWDVDVVTDITHTFAADLEIDVTSPGGTVVTLTTDNGGGNDDVFAGTTWDDDAGDANPPGPATDNTYDNLVVETPLVPEEALAAFLGEDPNGTWTISIVDDANLDTGTLNEWSLTLTTLAVAPIFDAPVSGTSTDTPIAIPDGPGGMASSTLTISGAETFVCDVDVTTDITHTFAADLEIDVTSPGGTVSTLTTDNGGGNDNVFAGTTWDDDAGDTNPPGPATDNTYDNLVVETPLVAEEALGAFLGEDPNGTWTISIVDDASDDTGTLNEWMVSVTTCACVGQDADLAVTKSGVASGTDVTWTVTVENLGPGDATGVVVTDPLDPCSTFVGDDCGGVDVPPWTWNVGPLPANTSATCNVMVDASGCPSGPLSNTATAAANETDPVPANNDGTGQVNLGNVLEIPTLDRAGLLLLLIALALGALVILRRRG